MTAPFDFTHVSNSQRVIFGTGQAGNHVGREVARLDARRPMVITGGTARAAAEQIIAGLDVALWWSGVLPHVPAEQATKAREAAAAANIDVIIAIGGGSTVGLAKAVALTSGLPVIAVPTTYAGSEATPVWGITTAARKTTGVDQRVLPVAVIYDAELTLDLPQSLTIASGMNALAHCVDSLWAPGANPLNALWAAEGMKALAVGLRVVKEAPRDLGGRERCLYGAYLSAAAFASAGSGIHHKICHVLGGTFDLPHAQTHAIVLPHVLAHQALTFPGAAQQVFRSLSGTDGSPAGDGVATLQRLASELGSPTALRDHGFRETDIPEAAELISVAVAVLPGPQPDLADIKRILFGAWSGAIAVQQPAAVTIG